MLISKDRRNALVIILYQGDTEKLTTDLEVMEMEWIDKWMLGLCLGVRRLETYHLSKLMGTLSSSCGHGFH